MKFTTFSYPKKVEYWICSDDRTFPTEKQALDWEAFLNKTRNDPANSNVNSITSDEIYPFSDEICPFNELH